MPRDDTTNARFSEGGNAVEDELRSLTCLSSHDGDLLDAKAPSSDSDSSAAGPAAVHHSALSRPPPEGQPRTPRTSNRVRFDLDFESDEESPPPRDYTRSDDDASWLDEEDYNEADSRRRSSTGQLAPLLTDIEAPSVTLATSGNLCPEEHLENARPRSGLRMAFMNMANSIIGAGIIGQPYAFRQAGITVGILLLAALTVTVDWTIRLIVVNSKLSGTDSFQATVQHCFGKSGLIAISVAQWVFAFGGMIAFCIIVGDTIPHVFASLFPSLKDMTFLWLLTDRRAVIVIFILCISYPLSLYRDIAKLAKASAFALLSMLIIVITVVIEGIRAPSDLRGDIKGYLLVRPQFFQAVGVISFAFVCHHNSLLIYGSLKKPTLDRFAVVTHYSTGVSMVLCLIMATAGFLSFGSKTQGNVLNNFPTNNVLVNIARLCFGLNMLTTLPLETFVCRSVMTTYYFPDEPFNPNRHLMFTTALVLTATFLALITCDLGAVFELIGATSAAALAYILPPLCYVKLSKSSHRAKLPAYACIAFGSMVMAMSLFQAVGKMIKNEDGTRTCGGVM